MAVVANIVVYLIHGFLGTPSDWDLFETNLGSFKKNLKSHQKLSVVKIKLFSDETKSSNDLSMEEWAHRLNTQVLSDNATHRLLVGYSLGGRLALHLLCEGTGVWQGAVLLSTHAGLNFETNSLELIRERILTDAKWSKSFQSETWQQVMLMWAAQSVFSKDECPIRKEEDYNKKFLGKALINWSLGVQKLSLRELKAINCPVIWMCGEHDKKFSDHMKRLKKLGAISDFRKISDVGHRLIFDKRLNSSELIEEIVTLSNFA